MNTCPHCQRPILARTILFSAYPVWITCPGCHTKLIGNRLIKTQGILVPIVSALVAIPIAFAELPFIYRIGLGIVAGTVIGLPNVFVTLKWGHYDLRHERSA